MTLEEQTKSFIENYIKTYYYKALEKNAKLSVESTGMNTYKATLGNMTLLFLGNAEGFAEVVSCEGDIF